MSGEKEENIAHGKGVNYYVISAIIVGTLIFLIGNSIEPVVAEEFDFFELLTSLGFAAATIFSFLVWKRYRGSKVFGKSYLSLTIAYLSYSIGWNLFWVYEIIYRVENPYPYYPDIFFFAFYPLAIIHLRTNLKGFKQHLSNEQKIIIIVFPIVLTTLYAFFGLFPIEVEGGLNTITVQPLPQYDQTFYKEYFVGLIFVICTSITFSYAIVAAQVFRETVLGPAWGLLLLGILLNTLADIYYYILELFGSYDRANPITGIWLAGTVFLCYALYLHRKEI